MMALIQRSCSSTRMTGAQTEMLSFWQLQVQPVMKISLKWHFRVSATIITSHYFWQVSGVPFAGYLGVYSGGGFIATLDISQAVSQRVLDELQQHLWLDRLTRAIILEFTVYCANIDLFGCVTMVAERGQTGGLIHKSSVQVLRAYGMGASTIFIYICGVIFMIFYFGYIVVEIKNVKQLRCRAYFRRPKTYLNLAVIVIGSGMFGFFVYRTVELNKTMGLIREDITQYVQFRKVATIDDVLKYFVAFMNLVVILKLVILLRLHQRMSDLLSTMRQTVGPLTSYFTVFVCMLIGYTGFCMVVYGPYMSGFRSVIISVETMVTFALGSFDLEAMLGVNEIVTKVFFASYMVSGPDELIGTISNFKVKFSN